MSELKDNSASLKQGQLTNIIDDKGKNPNDSWCNLRKYKWVLVQINKNANDSKYDLT